MSKDDKQKIVSDELPPVTAQNDPTEYDRFKAGLKQILSVSKEELDRREAEWRRERQAKKNKKASK